MATHLRVLILEDNPPDAELMLHELRRAEFDPDWVRVETEADYLAHLSPELDIILADYLQPTFDALQALRILHERQLDIPFIVITGNIDEVAITCMKQGANDYLLKNNLARLGQAVIKALDEKRVRVAAQQAAETLQQSEEKFRQFFKNSPAYCYMLAPDGEIRDVNKLALAELGYSKNDLIGKPLSSIYAPESIPRAKQLFERWVTTGTLGDEVLQVITKDGEKRSVLLSAGAIKDKDGKIIHSVSIQKDITSRKQMEADLQDALTRMTDALEGTVTTIAKIVEMRDLYTSGHQRNVADLAGVISEQMGFSPTQVKGIRHAALVHDLGKMAIPLETLSKPGKLTEIEFKIVKTHPQVAYEVLKSVEFPWPIAQTFVNITKGWMAQAIPRASPMRTFWWKQRSWLLPTW